jgi:hypothetical protein
MFMFLPYIPDSILSYFLTLSYFLPLEQHIDSRMGMRTARDPLFEVNPRCIRVIG